MSNKIENLKVETEHGSISVQSSGSGSPALLLIHGNSSCSKIWRHILSSDLRSKHRIVAIDLPGHGSSSDAPDPFKSYTQPAYADAALQVLRALDIHSVIILGWSLGGHIGIEMLPLTNKTTATTTTTTATATTAPLSDSHAITIQGLMIVGTPPIGQPHDIDTAFHLGPQGWRNAPSGRAHLSADEIDAFSRRSADPPYEAWMGEAVARTDGQARLIMFEDFAGVVRGVDGGGGGKGGLDGRGSCSDQQRVVAETAVCVAVVNGKEEPFINLDFIKALRFGNLWKEQCLELEGLEHAPFWGDPVRFQGILEEFVRDVSKY